MRADTPLRIDVAAEESPQIRTAFILLLGRLECSKGLDPVIRGVEPLDGRIVANERLHRVLHGEATGIPLHIIFTDLPLGAWWMAQFLDLFPDDDMRRASTCLVGLRVVAAVPTALTGWAEWARADRGTGRVRIVHATANAAATLIFLGSWAARSRSRPISASGLADGEAWSSWSAHCAVGTCAATVRPYPTPVSPNSRRPKQGER